VHITVTNFDENVVMDSYNIIKNQKKKTYISREKVLIKYHNVRLSTTYLTLFKALRVTDDIKKKNSRDSKNCQIFMTF